MQYCGVRINRRTEQVLVLHTRVSVSCDFDVRSLFCDLDARRVRVRALRFEEEKKEQEQDSALSHHICRHGKSCIDRGNEFES